MPARAKSTPPAPVIETRDLSFSYGEIPVLEKVTLDVAPLEFTSIVGPNGGGKTTLLRLILGLLQPAEGSVRLFGRPPAEGRRRVGYVPQHSLHDPLFPVSVLDVVLMGRLGLQRGFRYDRRDRGWAHAALEEMDLDELSRRSFSALSGGQRQRVLIARALATRPEILVLDEPTANVDSLVEERLFELLAELNRRMTVLIVSHDLGFVSNRVKRVICVNRTACAHPTSRLTAKIIRDLYAGSPRAVRHGRTRGRGRG